MPKQYLGDGVYVDNDGFQIVLTTEGDLDNLNTIYLDGNVFNALRAYVDQLHGEANA